MIYYSKLILIILLVIAPTICQLPEDD